MLFPRPQVCIGAGTELGEQCSIDASVIGRNCVIGRNVELTGCYVFDNVVIQDGAKLRWAAWLLLLHCLMVALCGICVPT